MRIAPSKDHTNGVLGPAHVLEALQETAKIEGLEDFGSVAEDFYCRHSFNQLQGCWNRVNPDGVEESPDNTFNHQLYFAAVASQLRSAKAVQDVSSFCGALGETLGVHSNGLIRHSVQRPQPETSVRQRLLAVFRKKTGDSAGATTAKEWSYHCYNLHGFSILALGVPDFMSCIEEKWHRIVEFTDGEKFSMWRREAGKTTMPLVSGQETLACDYALYRMVFCGDRLQSHAQAVEAELDRNQAPCGAACLFSADPETQRARVYRYWRLCGDPVGQRRASHA